MSDLTQASWRGDSLVGYSSQLGDTTGFARREIDSLRIRRTDAGRSILLLVGVAATAGLLVAGGSASYP